MEGNNVAKEKGCRATSQRDTRINYTAPSMVPSVVLHGLLAASILLINGHGTNF